MIVCTTLFYLSRNTNGTSEENFKTGIKGCTIAFASFGALFLPDSLLRRPHPVFWRIITSLSILWLLFITTILFQGRDEARQYLSFFDKNLGKPLPDRNYADACELTQDTFPYIKLDHFIGALDFYMVAHLLGWYVKMLIIRDFKLCWFLSIFFEILEITFRHWLPNFWECWWDHAILDILGMNALGIFLGDITCKFFEMKNYAWIRNLESEKNYKLKSIGIVKKFHRFLNYFTPNFWVKHKWDLFSSTKRFYSVLWFFVFMNLVDLSHFFMKYILWIPPTHYILEIRIYIWGLLAMISAREYYEYVVDDSCKRFGMNVWLSHLILFVELAIVFKFSKGTFKEPFPDYVIYFWTFVFIILSGITIRLVIKDFIKYLKKGQVFKKGNLTEPEIEIENIDDDLNS
jgi:phosphatidylserine synthase 2